MDAGQAGQVSGRLVRTFLSGEIQCVTVIRSREDIGRLPGREIRLGAVRPTEHRGQRPTSLPCAVSVYCSRLFS